MLSEIEKQTLKKKIQANQHEIYVISMEEMEAIIQSSPNGRKQRVKVAWEKLKGKVGTGVNYYASADDLVTMTKLISDLGGVGTKVYIKNYGGKAHIVIKGYAGLRKVLTSTKYGIKNPKVISLGLGKSGAIAAARQGGILSIVLLSIYRVADYFLTDEASLSQLIGSLASDVVKVGIATGASIAAASAFVATGFTIAIGPIAAVVIVGVLTSLALGELDQRFGITEKIIEGLDEIGEHVGNKYEILKIQLFQEAGKVVDSVFDYATATARKMVINTAKHAFDPLFSRDPRL